jgi:phosphoglycerate kinase
MKTLNQLLEKNLAGAKVLVRCDFNVPMAKRKVLDRTRILQHKKTIDALVAAGAKVILLSHFKNPGGKHIKNLSLTPILSTVREALSQEIDFISDCIGHAACWLINNSSKKVFLAENTRFHSAEENNCPNFAKDIAALGDFFVNDAFSVAHRNHASVLGVAELLPSFAGFALMAELEGVEKHLAKPKRPSLAILGGAKIKGKIGLLRKLLPQMDEIAVGGAMANAFLVAQDKMSNRIAKVEDKFITRAGKILAEAQEQGTKILLPVDVVCAKKLEAGVETQTYPLAQIPNDVGCFDIGAESTKAIIEAISKAETILWNGPLGAFEIKPFDRASLLVASAVSRSPALSVAGGGETLNVIHLAESASGWTHLSTAGGAFLTWLEKKPMPALEVLIDKKNPIT